MRDKVTADAYLGRRCVGRKVCGDAVCGDDLRGDDLRGVTMTGRWRVPASLQPIRAEQIGCCYSKYGITLLGATESPLGAIVTREVVTRHIPVVKVRGGAMRGKKFVGLKNCAGWICEAGWKWWAIFVLSAKFQVLYLFPLFLWYICGRKWPFGPAKKWEMDWTN